MLTRGEHEEDPLELYSGREGSEVSRSVKVSDLRDLTAIVSVEYTVKRRKVFSVGAAGRIPVKPYRPLRREDTCCKLSRAARLLCHLASPPCTNIVSYGHENSR